MDSSKAKDTVEESKALLGNATAHFTVEHRKSVMKHMNKDPCPLCEGKFPKHGSHYSKAKKNSRQHSGSKRCCNMNIVFFLVWRLKQGKTALESPVHLEQECTNLTKFSIQLSQFIKASLKVSEIQSGQKKNNFHPTNCTQQYRNRYKHILGFNQLPVPLVLHCLCLLHSSNI